LAAEESPAEDNPDEPVASETDPSERSATAPASAPIIADAKNFPTLLMCLGIFGIIYMIAEHHSHQLVHPAELQGAPRTVAAALAAVVIALVTVSLVAAMTTFFTRNRSRSARNFHSALGERIAFALIVASLLAIFCISSEPRNIDIDIVDAIGRITAVVTLIAIATCAYLGYKAIWFTLSQLTSGLPGDEKRIPGKVLAVVFLLILTALSIKFGYHIYRLIVEGNGLGKAAG
jgi:hypothetical protein